jgi:hypothetical protein
MTTVRDVVAEGNPPKDDNNAPVRNVDAALTLRSEV